MIRWIFGPTRSQNTQKLKSRPECSIPTLFSGYNCPFWFLSPSPRGGGEEKHTVDPSGYTCVRFKSFRKFYKFWKFWSCECMRVRACMRMCAWVGTLGYVGKVLEVLKVFRSARVRVRKVVKLLSFFETFWICFWPFLFFLMKSFNFFRVARVH